MGSSCLGKKTGGGKNGKGPYGTGAAEMAANN